MGNRKLILILAIMGIIIAGLLLYYLKMLGGGEKNFNSLYDSPILTKNCYADTDCSGLCNPRGCFSKGAVEGQATGCSGSLPSCVCIDNKCEETGK